LRLAEVEAGTEGHGDLGHYSPFALSLSKPVLSDAAGGVEGGIPSFMVAQEGTGFDKLSPNGGKETNLIA
jgi:hypothetical protein